MLRGPAFSLLLPVWAGDRADHLRLAFHSAVHEQTLRPSEVVVVRDGPLPAPLRRCLDELKSSSPVPVIEVGLSRHGGLGRALDVGLRHCQHDVVARMDADDISVPHRFATQLPQMVEADLVGSGLYEFHGSLDNVVGQRTPPVGSGAIRAYARLHDPFNHPTIVYRRSAVIAAGGYGDLPLMEDYWLFARMIANGAAVLNIPEPLVYYRVGPDSYRRRGGRKLLWSELQLQRQLRDEGFISPLEYRRNVVVRGAYRMIPWRLRRGLYRSLVKGWGRIPARSSVPRSSARPDTFAGAAALRDSR